MAASSWSRRTCPPPHRLFWAAALLVCGAMIVTSEIGLLRGDWDMTFWPWNRSWFMFSWTDGYHRRMALTGRFADGSVRDVDMSRWFTYPVGWQSWRYDEITRKDYDLIELIGFVCGKVNDGAPPGARLEKLSIDEYYWPQQRGRRLRFDEVPPESRAMKTLVTDVPCP